MAGSPDGEMVDLAAHAEAARMRLDQTRRYLQRGRLLRDLSDEQLSAVWVDAILDWARSHEARCGKAEDAAAEFALRNHEPPFELVRDAIGLLAARGLGAASRMDEAEKRASGARIMHAHRLERLRPN